MSLPKVSALCVTKDRPAFLRQSIKLFMAQTYPNRELVVVNNGDEKHVPWDIDRVPHVRYVRLDQKGSIEFATYYAAQAAQGDYLAVWDDDDWHGPQRLEKQATELIEGAEACGCATAMVKLPEAVFVEWRPEVVRQWVGQKSHSIPFHDGTAMWKRRWSDALAKPTQHMKLLQGIKDQGGLLVSVPNDALFVYVRHPSVGWKMDLAASTVEVPAPAWVTDEMMWFWRHPDLKGEL